ncbi:MAG: PAS domain S-box protein [Phycisphaerales bacterium]|nr:PAS domain S-box protein [Phycisphaerales bacterium]MCI0631105.1 PAS domain S-box protein [Phycisphaerales bacterium]MCI0675437.1 PAS domain S-box protein [Phycisphaerales bacterium]
MLTHAPVQTLGAQEGTASRRERMRVDELLLRLEEQDRVSFEMSAAGQVHSDARTGKLQRVNRKFCQMTGYGASELLGMTLEQLTHPEDRHAEAAGFGRLMTGEIREFSIEKRLMRKDGQSAWVNTATTIVFEGDQAQAISVIVDASASQQVQRHLVAQREQLEELVLARTRELEQSHQRLRGSERMAAIGTLAAGIGHDMGNLVLPILCRLDSVLNQPLPDAVRDELRSVRSAVGNLRQLSRGLRMFAMDPKESGRSSAVAIEPWWRIVEPMMKRLLPKWVVLQSQISPDLPPIAIAHHQLTQMILNLLINAGEAIVDRGTIRVWAQASPDGGGIRIGVTDNGPGMPDSVRKHALDPFFTTKTRTLSTGLGLPQVHSICRSAGGSMEIDSVPGGGTTVVITLPVSHTDQAAAGCPPKFAHVALADRRLASYATALLQSSGFVLSSNDRESDSLWITEPVVHGVEEVRQFVQRKQGRRAIVVGSPDAQWNEPEIVVVDGSYRQMREALHRASKELSEHEETHHADANTDSSLLR